MRRSEDDLIGVSEESCRFDPMVGVRYAAWAAANKPELNSFVPDPRLMKWARWESVPRELQPFFHIDPTINTRTVIRHGRNAYEEVMIRKAVRRNNQQLMDGLLAALSEKEG